MSNLFEHCRVGVSSAKPRRRIYSLQHYGAMGRRAGRSLRPRSARAVLRRLRPARSAIQPTRVGHVWKINNHGCAIAHHELRLAKTREKERPSVPGGFAWRMLLHHLWCQKVVNPLLAGNAKEKVRNGSEAHSCRPKVCQNIQLLLRLCKLRCTALRTLSDCSGYFPASSGTCSFAAAIFCRLISLAASLSRRR